MPRDAERRQLHASQSAWTLTSDRFGLDSKWSLLHGIGLDLKTDRVAGPAGTLTSSSTFVSDTGQLRWDISQSGAGYYTVDTPRSKLFTGFIRGRKFHLGNVDLAVGSTRLDWATVTMTTMEGHGFDSPGRLLIAATGLVHNQGAELETLDGNRITLRDRWVRRLSCVRAYRPRLYSRCPPIGSPCTLSIQPATEARPSNRPLATATPSSRSAPFTRLSGTKWSCVDFVRDHRRGIFPRRRNGTC